MDRSLCSLVISFSSFAFYAGVPLFLTFLFLGFGAICSVMIEAVTYTIWLILVKVSGALMSFLISIIAELAVVIASPPRRSLFIFFRLGLWAIACSFTTSHFLSKSTFISRTFSSRFIVSVFCGSTTISNLSEGISGSLAPVLWVCSVLGVGDVLVWMAFFLMSSSSASVRGLFWWLLFDYYCCH